MLERSIAVRSQLSRAEVAQLAEHSPEKAGVDSSILSLGTTPIFLQSYIDLDACREAGVITVLTAASRRVIASSNRSGLTLR